MVSEPLASEIALDPVDEALDDIGDFFEEAWDDTRDFIKDHPIISGALAIATGTWFISAAGGLAAAGAKLATGITNVIGSFTPTISSTSVGASINVGSFASASVGAGVNGLTVFAGANLSILGVPVWGVGSSLSALGSFGSTIGGSITNNLLGGPSLFGSGGSIDVGSFAKATVNSTLTVLANESGLTTVHDAFHATRETAQDIYRALAPPPPPVIMQPVSYGASGLTPVEGTPDLQSVGPTGGNPFSGLGDWPTFDVSQGYYESGSGDYNGTRLVGYPSSAPQSEGFSWESVPQPFTIDWGAVTDPAVVESFRSEHVGQFSGPSNLERQFIQGALSDHTNLPWSVTQELIEQHDNAGTLTTDFTFTGRDATMGFAFPVTTGNSQSALAIVEFQEPGWFTGGSYKLSGVVPTTVNAQSAIQTLITEPQAISEIDKGMRAFEFGMASVPGLSTGLDIYELTTGKDWTNGDKLSSQQYNDAVKAGMIPSGIGRKNVEYAGDLLNSITRRGPVVPKGTATTLDTIPEGRRLIPYWPTNRGFANTPTTTTLKPGTRIDRYGYDGGTFVSPQGVPAPKRSLAPGTTDKPYSVFEVVKPLDAQTGRAAPWFGQPGGGVQHELGKSVKQLLEEGVIRRVQQ